MHTSLTTDGIEYVSSRLMITRAILNFNLKMITAHLLKPLNYLRLRLVWANAEPAIDLEILL